MTGYRDNRPSDHNKPDDPPAEWGALRSWVGTIRFAAGFIVAIALIILLIDTIRAVDEAIEFGASAVQVIQIYAERVFYAVAAIGVGIAIYIGTRAYKP